MGSHAEKTFPVAISLLLLESDEPLSRSLTQYFADIARSKIAIIPTVVTDRESLIARLQSHPYHCIVIDYHLAGWDGLRALKLVRDMAPDLPAIFFTDPVGEETAVECMIFGAVNFIWRKQREKLLPAILSAVSRNSPLPPRKKGIGETPAKEGNPYFHFLETLPVMAFLKDADSRFLYANRKCYEYYPFAEWIGKTPHQVLPAEYAEMVCDTDLSALKCGYIAFEEEYRDSLGRVHPLATQKYRIDFESRGPLIGVIQEDIRERKIAYQALRESEQRFQTLCEISPVGIFRTDAQGITTYVNPRWSEISGLEGEKGLGDGWLSVVHPEDRKLVIQGWDAAVQERSVSYKEYRFLRPDGKIAWVLGYAVPEYDAGGVFSGYVGTITDITQLKQVELELRESEKRYRNLYENAAIGIYRAVPGERLLFANPYLVNMLGYDTFQDLVSADSFATGLLSEADLRRLDALSDGKQEIRGLEITRRKKGGEEIFLLENIRVTMAADGRIAFYDGIVEDITEQKRLREQLIQSQKMEAIGQLAGGVAHDYNNMIGIILGYANLLEEELPSSGAVSLKIKSIREAAERSANLTRQLLAFARKQVITPVALDMNEELSLLQKILGRLIGENITLTLSPGDDLWLVKMDRVQISQIVTNLCANSRDAISDIGTITIATANHTFHSLHRNLDGDMPPGEYVLLSVADTGSGMDRATLAHIYEPFFTTKPQGHGTGLSLATIFGIVKQNDGFIQVKSAPGEGTTFQIFLPRFHGEREPEKTKTMEAVSLQGNEMVLVVEDEPELLHLVCTVLQMYGYRVRSATSPQEALQVCREREENIDLLITDVIMPGMNGRELKERLTRLYPHLKTLFISGYTADIVAEGAVLDQGVSFLQKPFTASILAEKVREVMNVQVS